MTTLTVHDYALYLGAPCQCKSAYTPFQIDGTIEGVNFSKTFRDQVGFISAGDGSWHASECMLILRRLSSMTETEARELFKIVNEGQDWAAAAPCLRYWWTYYDDRFEILNEARFVGEPTVWRWLLAHHFDLFGWIGAGLALDAAELLSPVQPTEL